jgi:hypothetical protein
MSALDEGDEEYITTHNRFQELSMDVDLLCENENVFWFGLKVKSYVTAYPFSFDQS